MTEERKFAILFAATILAARRLIDMDPDKSMRLQKTFRQVMILFVANFGISQYYFTPQANVQSTIDRFLPPLYQSLAELSCQSARRAFRQMNVAHVASATP